MSHERDFESALAKAGAFVEPLLDRVGYRAARPPYHYPESTLLNGEGALESIGRFDGLDKRPTLYLTASPTAAVLETRYAKEQHGRFVKYHAYKTLDDKVHELLPLCIIPVRVSLERVLLVNKALHLLPISEEELYDEKHDVAPWEEYVPVHALARAARRSGIQGVLYESRHERKSHNLAVFVENVPKGSMKALYGKSPLCPGPIPLKRQK